MKLSRLAFVFIVILMVAQASFAGTVRFQQGLSNQFYPAGYNGVQDTCIISTGYMGSEQWEIGQERYFNYGGSPYMTIGVSEDEYHYDLAFGLIRFDLVCLTGLQVESARLYLYYSAITPPDQPLNTPVAWPMFNEDKDWVAGTANGQLQAGSSAYAQKKTGSQDWINNPDSYWWQGTNQINFSVTGRTSGDFYEVCADIPVSLLSSWKSLGNNPGLRLYDGGTISLASIVSSDNPNAGLRPALEVTIVPEPSSIAGVLMGISSLVFLRRKAGNKG